MNNAEWEIKKKLDAVIKQAYPEQIDNKRLFYYKIGFTHKKSKTKLGFYRFNDRSITLLMGWDVGDTNHQVILIHELAHHVQHILQHYSKHDKAFFEINKQLLYAAFDLGIIDYQKSLQRPIVGKYQEWENDVTKQYRPSTQQLPSGMIDVSVYNCFQQRQQLKEQGYHWDGVDKRWFKTIDCQDLEREYEFLHGIEIPDGSIKTTDSNTLHVINDDNTVRYGILAAKKWTDFANEGDYRKEITIQYKTVQSLKKRYKYFFCRKFASEEEALDWLDEKYRSILNKIWQKENA